MFNQKCILQHIAGIIHRPVQLVLTEWHGISTSVSVAEVFINIATIVALRHPRNVLSLINNAI